LLFRNGITHSLRLITNEFLDEMGHNHSAATVEMHAIHRTAGPHWRRHVLGVDPDQR